MQSFILPEEKLNELAQEVSTRLFERHYFEKDQITGEALATFASHNQVNRFLIFQVFQVWEMQLNKLAHPYFDLEQEEIQQSLQALKNQISRFIRISKADFQPMLKRAVYNNLRLLLFPKETLESFFFAQNDTLPLETYDRHAQFFADLDFVVANIQKYHHKKELVEVEKATFFEKMEKVAKLMAKKGGKTLDTYCAEQFEVLTGRDRDSYLETAEAEVKAQEEKRARQEEAERQEAARIAQEEATAARLKAEEEAREAAEEEAKRKAEEEETKRQAEQEETKLSFFDKLPEAAASELDLDLDLDEDLDEEQEEDAKEEKEKQAPPISVVAPTEEKEEKAPTEESEEEAVEEEEEATSETTSVEIPVEVVAETEDEPEDKAADEQEEVPAKEEKKPKESTQAFLDRFLQERLPQQEEAPASEDKPEVQESETPKAESAPEEVVAPPVVEAAPEKDSKTPPETSQKVSSPTPSVAEDQESTERTKTVVDAVNDRPQTIAEKFAQQSNAPLAETLSGNRRIKLDEIPIHKQYQYVQKVFEGNNVRFRIIVDKVNNATNKEEVEDILNKFVLNNSNLDRSDNVVNEFIDLLRNRF